MIDKHMKFQGKFINLNSKNIMETIPYFSKKKDLISVILRVLS